MNRPTTTYQARLDVRSIATVIKAFQSMNTPIRNRSNLIWMVLEHFVDILVNNGVVERVEDIEEAMNIINNSGLPLIDKRTTNKELLAAIKEHRFGKLDKDRIRALAERGAKMIEEELDGGNTEL